MASIEVVDRHVVYENPEPQLRARNGFFPGAVRLPSGDLVAFFVLGEAMNATNGNTVVTRSKDGGRTWNLQGPLYERPPEGEHYLNSFKPTLLDDGTLIATGYNFHRTDPDQRLANSETDGLRDGDNLVSFSKDEGHTWTVPRVVPRSWPELIEVSGPSIQLHDGTVLCCGSLFPRWDGSHPSNNVAVLLRSTERGETWSDKTIFYRHPEGHYTAAEPRLCEMQPGRIACLFWTMDHVGGTNLPNHMTVSHDGGHTWGEATDTGMLGQASNLTYLGGDTLLTIHCHREGKIGLYVRIVDFANDRWNTVEELNLWDDAPSQQVSQYKNMANNLKFGQASLLHMGGDEYLAFFWCIEDGQGKILTRRLRAKV
jgi:sialidase-1